MTPPPIPAGEHRRLQVLRELAILDAPPDDRLDVITAYCRSRFGVAIALVSLVDEARQWFASRQGLAPQETPREVSFCAHAVAAGAPLVVTDAMCDPRFADNPLVTGAPGIRFYAGALIRVNDQALGTVCLIDPRPRHAEADLLAELQDIADAVASLLEQRVPGPYRLDAESADGHHLNRPAEGADVDPWQWLVSFSRSHPHSADAATVREIVFGLRSRTVPRPVLHAKARRLSAEAGQVVSRLLAMAA